MGAVPQKPARCTAPSATCAVGFGEELLLLGNATSNSWQRGAELGAHVVWCRSYSRRRLLRGVHGSCAAETCALYSSLSNMCCGVW